MKRQPKKIFFEAIGIIDNSIAYASLRELNGLFRVDLKSNNCTYLSMFPNEKEGENRLHCSAEYYNNKIYFIPRAADYISILDLNTEKIYQTAIPVPAENKKLYYYKKAKFAASCIYNNSLWMLPATFPGILKMNMDTEEITVIDNWVSDKKYYFRNSMCKINNRLFFPDAYSNAVIELDMTSGRAEVNFVGKDNRGCSSMCSADGINIWMAPVYGPIIKWNYKNDTAEEYSNYPKGFIHKAFDFSKVYSIQNYIYFIPEYGNMAIKFDTKKNIMTENKEDIFKNALGSDCLFETDSFIYFLVYYNGFEKGYKISKSTNEISDGSFFFLEGENKRCKKHIEAVTGKAGIINESVTFGLKEFLTALSDEKNLLQTGEDNNGFFN